MTQQITPPLFLFRSRQMGQYPSMEISEPPIELSNVVSVIPITATFNIFTIFPVHQLVAVNCLYSNV